MEAAKKIPLVVVAGPTASGKTAAAIHICQKFDGEVVSADSMQIYKYLSVGTAKPDEKEKAGIPHHLMDFLEPSQPFSVAEYVQLAKEAIADIHRRGKLPVVVGGTGLYVDYPNANAKNCAQGFDKFGHGAVVISGSAITGSWMQEEGENPDALVSAEAAAQRLKKNLNRYVTIL